MSENSTKAITKLLKVEGGFVNNPLDTGGATNYGITKAVYEAYIGRTVTVAEIQNMPIGNAMEIYKSKYWDTIGGDYIKSYAVAYIIFDQGVNRGPASAIGQVCSVLGIPKVSAINSNIIEKLNNFDPEKFVELYLDQSAAFYNALVVSKPTQIIFLKGWLNRVADIRNYALANLGQVTAMVKDTLNDNPWIYALPAFAVVGVVVYFNMNKGNANGNRSNNNYSRARA